MTDLIEVEARLRAVLAEEADAVPAVAGLAADARRRHRMRRGRRVWTASLMVVIVLPLVFAVLVRATGHTRSDPAERPDAETATRQVIWHQVSVSVPATWPDGQTSRWCNGDEPIKTSTPLVTTPDVPAPPVDYACNPAHGFGVEVGHQTDLLALLIGAIRQGGSGPELQGWQIATAGTWQYLARDPDRAAFPDGAWVRYVDTLGGGVLVVTAQRSLTERIAATVSPTGPTRLHTVTWAGGVLQVPPAWVDGATTDWCVGDESVESMTPRVELPGTTVRDILCDPATGYGVSVRRGPGPTIATPGGPAVQYVEPPHRHPLPPYPDRSWVASARVGAWSVVVVAADRRTAETVAASAQAAPVR